MPQLLPRVKFCLLSVCFLIPGCMGDSRWHLSETTGGNAALFGQFAAYDGRTGKQITFDDMARRCRKADVVLFGESHYDSVCNGLEAQLFSVLAEQHSTALAMEFFERDTQTAINDYLAGRTTEADMTKKARQGKQYATSHRPLIELCKAGGNDVIAANTPRRFLGKFRESGLPFDQFRATLTADDQKLVARTSTPLKGAYYEHWREVMKNHPMPPAASGPASAPTSPAPAAPVHARQPDGLPRGFLSQLLWDDTMSESIADHRAAHPNQRVMLVVGSFHVASDGGTAVKLHERRPDDRTCIVVYRGDTKLPAAMEAEDKNAADVVVYGITAPEK